MSDLTDAPKVLGQPLTKAEEKALDETLVTNWEQRQKLLEDQRNQRRAVAQGEASQAAAPAAPIGSSEGTESKLPEKLAGLIPGISAKPSPDQLSSEPDKPSRSLKDVPDLLEDIRESVARIQDRSYLLDQKPEYPPRAPPVEPVVGPDELCSRRYGYCRTIPMILTDIAFHLRTIATVPSRQQLLKDAEQGQQAPFQKSQAPAPPAVQSAPYQKPMGPAQRSFFAPRNPFSQNQSTPFPPSSRPPPGQPPIPSQGFNPPGGPSLGPPAEVPKPNSMAPPQVDGENTNEDTGDGLDDDAAPPKQGGGFEEGESFPINQEDIPIITEGTPQIPFEGDDGYSLADGPEDDLLDSQLDDDSYYKIVTINQSEQM